MKFLNVNMEIKNIPELDKTYIPFSKFMDAFLKTAKEPISIAIERNNGLVSKFDTCVHGTREMEEADKYYVERLVKFLLWARGGYKVYIGGNKEIGNFIKKEYSKAGKRAFDNKFMTRVYDKNFEVIITTIKDMPDEKEDTKAIDRHLEGCRIGFDAGGSYRKVSAVIDGKTVYSEEVAWSPKTNSDPNYHYNEILKSFKIAASKMPKVDAIGVSSAGICINNQVKVASLFIKIPDDVFDKKVKNIYIKAAREIGDIPLEVINDGEVTALAGSMSLNGNKVLGIAMGTSQAAGYVDSEGNITSWLNELAFCPVDLSPTAMEDEWSGDIGCGVKYLSQDGAVKLIPKAGIELDENLSPADRLKFIRKLVEDKNEDAKKIYETLGCYLAHSIALYTKFYDIEYVLLLGGVTRGKGGNIILNTAKSVLKEDYPGIAKQINLQTPDGKARYIGQSVAVASLSTIK